MQKLTWFRFLLLLACLGALADAVQAQGILGDAPVAPKDLSGLPGGGPHPNTVSGGFSVNIASREQVREFYNAVYASSTGTPINSTAVTASCFAGTNSMAFANATLRRINWFRAMAGLPAAVTFDATESTKDQAAAIMMAEHGTLQHTGVWTNWDCLTTDGTNAAANSNLDLGNDGPDAITTYILDYGTNNYDVGHRRWILYPQTQIMATGDVPPENSYYSANATWVFDANYGGPRPATRAPYVSWPPPGYVPYQVACPRWSFSLSNANLSAATVSMTSNGVALPVGLLLNTNGYGENTRAWYVATLDQNNGTTFPFNGTDTVYSVTVGNVMTTAGTKSFSYNVTLFDPATTGVDYSPLVINGPSQPSVGAGNAYSCTAAANPNNTSYQWLTTQTTNGNLVDNATGGLVNFTIAPVQICPAITNPPVGTGKCFHLCHTNFASESLQLNELLYPSNSTTLSFKSLLGYATSTEVAHVQISTDQGTTWTDLYTQPGTGGSGETAFTLRSFSLTNFAGKSVLARFYYEFPSGSNISFYPQQNADVGWCLENIIVTNSQKLLSQATNTTSSTNFVFTPTQTGNYLLQARGVIFNDFPTDLGTIKLVTAVVGPTSITLNSLAISNRQVTIKFTASGSPPSFHLLQTAQLGTTWTTNAGATLTTNVPGVSFQFATTNGPPARFYRVVTP